MPLVRQSLVTKKFKKLIARCFALTAKCFALTGVVQAVVSLPEIS
jgi:hypothetical protein